MKHVFVLDVDGTLTDGKMIYSKDGKQYKCFGCDDWNALQILKDYAKIHVISADKKGFPITERRIESECGYLLDVVPGHGQARWEWIRAQYPDDYIMYMGDGMLDWFPLSKADFGITTADALEHTKRAANLVTKRSGGNRAVAEAVTHIMLCVFNQRPERYCV